MTNIEAIRKITNEQGEFVDALTEEMKDLKEENATLKKQIKEYSELDSDVPYTEEIELSGGKIYVNVNSLNYMTKESFKEWCMKHAITNSEPVFNL